MASEQVKPDEASELETANAYCRELIEDRDGRDKAAERFDAEYSALYSQNAELLAALTDYVFSHGPRNDQECGLEKRAKELISNATK